MTATVPNSPDESTTTTARKVDAQDLKPGDIVHEFLSEDDDARREYAEVTHVEPVAGRNEVLVVLLGGNTVTWLDHGDIHLADPDEYEQHRQRIADENFRADHIAKLQRVVDLLRGGAPVPRRIEVRFGSMASPGAVRELADMLGVDAEDDDHSQGFTTRLSYEPERHGGFELVAYHYRSKTAEERRAFEERQATKETEQPAGGAK